MRDSQPKKNGKFYYRLPTRPELVDFLKHEPKNLIYDAIGSFIYAIGICTFAANADFAPGGVTGLAMILNYLFGLPLGQLTILINIPITVISLRYLGPVYMMRTFQTILMNAVFLDYVAPLFPTYQSMAGDGNSLLAALFAGALSGIGLAYMYRAGTCTGGSDFVIMSMKKIKPHLSIGQITLATDGALILAGAFVYKDVNAILYGIIFTIVSTVIIDKFMSGSIAGKMSLIISDHNEAIAKKINAEIGRGATYLKGEGCYTGKEKKVLMCASSKKQVVKLREIAREEDPDALVIIMDYSEVRGEGFLPNEDIIV